VQEPDWVGIKVVLACTIGCWRHWAATCSARKGLLQSALARPRHYFGYTKDCRIVDLAASYTSAIARDHPFVDGNKHTAFLVGVLFMEMNNCRFPASEQDAAVAVNGLAAGTLLDADYAAFLADHSK
jgi:death-on-curing protein